jgi:hypothetical protein
MYNIRSSINLCCASSTFLYKFVDPKKEVTVEPIAPTFFFPCYWLWSILECLTTALSFNTYYLLVSKWRWTLSTCVFIRVMPLVFPYLVKFFLTIELYWFRMLLEVCWDQLMMHFNIWRFNRSIGKLSFTTKKTLANKNSNVWFPQFHNLKIHFIKNTSKSLSHCC